MEIEQIFDKIHSGRNLLITGPAGTGKSTIIKKIKEKYTWKVVITSTTGISALNIDGCTIHTFAGMGILSGAAAIAQIKSQYNWSNIRNRIRRTHILMIDEVSMLSTEQLELLDLICREATRVNKPFGGITMVFVGDFLQLPPVQKDGHATRWIFDSDVWKSADIDVVHLYKIHRQDDPEFLKHLISVRFGWCFEDTDEFFKRRHFKENQLDSDILRFFSTNREADNYNQLKLDNIENTLHTFFAEVEAANEKYEKQIIESTLAPECLEIKIGARVMLLNNKKIQDTDDYLYVNGSLATVVEIYKGSPVVKLDTNGETVRLEKHSWTLKNWEDEELARFTQYPMKLAYGVTIHKSQGLTLDKAVIDCRNIFANGQAYVALSRVRNTDGLFLLNWNPSLIKADPVAVDFYLKSMEEC